MRIIKHPNGTLYAATIGNGVYKSTDNGLTWSASSMVSSTSSASYTDVDVDQAGNIYFSESGVGVLKFNSSETFIEVDSAGMFNKRIRGFFIDKSGNNPVYYVACEGATLNGNGYFFRKGLVATSNVDEVSSFKVNIYPNPAANYIKIESDEEIQSIQLTDLSGKEVITQTNLSALSIQLTTDMLPEATYFLHIKTTSGKTALKTFVKN